MTEGKGNNAPKTPKTDILRQPAPPGPEKPLVNRNIPPVALDAPRAVTILVDRKAEYDTFRYKDVDIKGIEFLERQGALNREDVIELLDRLPEGFFRYVPLESIIFEPYKALSIRRNGEVLFRKESELEEGDVVRRRVRGLASWNSEERDGVAVISDGRMNVQIFSLLDLEDKQHGQTDKEVYLYMLAHELGHTLLNTLVTAPDYYKNLRKRGIPYPRDPVPGVFSPLIEDWRKLEESTLQRYKDYKPIVIEESARGSDGRLKSPLHLVLSAEDFAISNEHYLYWRDLPLLDSDRYLIMHDIYERIETAHKNTSSSDTRPGRRK